MPCFLNRQTSTTAVVAVAVLVILLIVLWTSMGASKKLSNGEELKSTNTTLRNGAFQFSEKEKPWINDGIKLEYRPSGKPTTDKYEVSAFPDAEGLDLITEVANIIHTTTDGYPTDQRDVEYVTLLKISENQYEDPPDGPSMAKRHHSGHFRLPTAVVWDPHPQYEFTAFGRIFRLRLAHDSSFISPDVKITHVEMNQTIKNRPNHQPGCFYSGHVDGDPKSDVSVSLCDGMTGHVRTSNGSYIISPIEHWSGDSSDTLKHIFYRDRKMTSNIRTAVGSDSPTPSHECGVTDYDAEEKAPVAVLDNSSAGDIYVGDRYRDRRSTTTKILWHHSTEDVLDGKPLKSTIDGLIYPVHNEPNERNTPILDDHRLVRLKNGTSPIDGWRYRRALAREYFIEIMVVADKKMIQYHGNNLIPYILVLMSTVHRIYKDPSIGNPISIAVMKIVTVEQTFGTRYSNSDGISAAEMLKKFCEWQKVNNPNEPSPEHHDAALLLTRENLCQDPGEQRCETLGLAELGRMCSSGSSCAIVQDNGLATAFTIAHEIGHVLSMPHDDDPKCTKFEITSDVHNFMTRRLDNNTFRWEWSTCSRHYLTEFLENANCLLDEPSNITGTTDMIRLPGEEYSGNRQCELAFGPGATICPHKPEDVCKRLWCASMLVDRHQCRTQNMPWADGTPCGGAEPQMKRCHKGECASIKSLERVNGEWGEWGLYGDCSRTCGGGVQKKYRDCNGPPPQNGGDYCIGERVQYRSCGTEECSIDAVDFREEQCSKFDRNNLKIPGLAQDVQWHAKYIRLIPEDRCKLFCQVESSQYYMLRDKVIDGTPCGPDTFHICIHGKCRPAGCDHYLNSTAELDTCGICRGDNSTCHKIAGSYNSSVYGYTKVIKIPAGSSNIDIRQHGWDGSCNDSNYLGKRNQRSQQSQPQMMGCDEWPPLPQPEQTNKKKLITTKQGQQKKNVQRNDNERQRQQEQLLEQELQQKEEQQQRQQIQRQQEQLPEQELQQKQEQEQEQLHQQIQRQQEQQIKRQQEQEHLRQQEQQIQNQHKQERLRQQEQQIQVQQEQERMRQQKQQEQERLRHQEQLIQKQQEQERLRQQKQQQEQEQLHQQIQRQQEQQIKRQQEQEHLRQQEQQIQKQQEQERLRQQIQNQQEQERLRQQIQKQQEQERLRQQEQQTQKQQESERLRQQQQQIRRQQEIDPDESSDDEEQIYSNETTQQQFILHYGSECQVHLLAIESLQKEKSHLQSVVHQLQMNLTDICVGYKRLEEQVKDLQKKLRQNEHGHGQGQLEHGQTLRGQGEVQREKIQQALLQGLVQQGQLQGQIQQGQLQGLVQQEQLQGLVQQGQLQGQIQQGQLQGLVQQEQLQGLVQQEQLQGQIEQGQLSEQVQPGQAQQGQGQVQRGQGLVPQERERQLQTQLQQGQGQLQAHVQQTQRREAQGRQGEGQQEQEQTRRGQQNKENNEQSKNQQGHGQQQQQQYQGKKRQRQGRGPRRQGRQRQIVNQFKQENVQQRRQQRTQPYQQPRQRRYGQQQTTITKSQPPENQNHVENAIVAALRSVAKTYGDQVITPPAIPAACLQWPVTVPPQSGPYPLPGMMPNYALRIGEGGKHILNGQFMVMHRKVIIRPGLTIEYSGPETPIERLNSSRPINVDLTVEVLSVGNVHPPQVTYEYTVPKNILKYYTWILRDWSDCNYVCDGEKHRRAQCQNIVNKEFVPDDYCMLEKKPREEHDTCNTYCSLKWQITVLSECSNHCGPGNRTISSQCVQILKAAGGETMEPISNLACLHIKRPSNHEACIGPCDAVHWSYGEWGACSTSCGGGEQSRTATCVDLSDTTVADSKCVARKRLIQRICGLETCPQWSFGEWSPCSTTCGQGKRKRPAWCHIENRVVSESHCTSPKPDDTEVCSAGPCQHRWDNSNWDACNSDCGSGQQHRRVRCKNGRSDVLPDTDCYFTKKPKQSKKCHRLPCATSIQIGKNIHSRHRSKRKWTVSSWTPCSKDCGEGIQQRDVSCHRINRFGWVDPLPVDGCLPENRPSKLKNCKLRDCNDKYYWLTGNWRKCSHPCGRKGKQIRRIFCYDVTGKQKPRFNCPRKFKPKRERKCNQRRCNPKTCLEVKKRLKAMHDGEYKLLIGGKSMRIYCHNMATETPLEYLTLPAGDRKNYAEIYDKRLLNPNQCPFNGRRNESCDCVHDDGTMSGSTNFKRIRINPINLIIIADDFTFSRTKGTKRVDFGKAGDCYSRENCPQGRFSIDFTGTQLKLSSGVTWDSQKSKAVMAINKVNDQKITGKCGGYCGFCMPKNGLKLDVLPT